MPDVISYLSRNRGRNLERLLGLHIIDEQQRFDSRRFDILAYDVNTDRFVGIKDHSLSSETDIDSYAKWLHRFNGYALLLVPHTLAEKIPSGTPVLYYAFANGMYSFSEKPRSIAQDIQVNPLIIVDVVRAAKKPTLMNLLSLGLKVYKSIK